MLESITKGFDDAQRSNVHLNFGGPLQPRDASQKEIESPQVVNDRPCVRKAPRECACGSLMSLWRLTNLQEIRVKTVGAQGDHVGCVPQAINRDLLSRWQTIGGIAKWRILRDQCRFVVRSVRSDAANEPRALSAGLHTTLAATAPFACWAAAPMLRWFA